MFRRENGKIKLEQEADKSEVTKFSCNTFFYIIIITLIHLLVFDTYSAHHKKS